MPVDGIPEHTQMDTKSGGGQNRRIYMPRPPVILQVQPKLVFIAEPFPSASLAR
jgi:hypothetical protein